MLELLIAAVLLAAAPQGGTVYTTEGGRLRGTVVEAGAAGVTVQLADGTTRKIQAAQVSRVDFADGTSWKPGAAPAATPQAAAPVAASQAAVPAQPAPAAAPTAAAAPPSAPAAAAAAPAAAVAPTATATATPTQAATAAPTATSTPTATAPPAAATGPVATAAVVPVAAAPAAPAAPAAAAPTGTAIPLDKLDTVHLARGGRVRCFVIEGGPDGVVVRLTDGTERRYGPGQVTRIDWADGTRLELAAPSAAAAPATR